MVSGVNRRVNGVSFLFLYYIYLFIFVYSFIILFYFIPFMCKIERFWGFLAGITDNGVCVLSADIAVRPDC